MAIFLSAETLGRILSICKGLEVIVLAVAIDSHQLLCIGNIMCFFTLCFTIKLNEKFDVDV